MVWYGMVWYGMVWYGMVWYGMVWYGMVWYGMVWYGMVWYGMVWYGMVWYSTVQYSTVQYSMWFQLRKNEEAPLKISLHRLIVHWMSIKISPERVIATQCSKKVLTEGQISIFH